MRQLYRCLLALVALGSIAVASGPAAAAPFGVEVVLSWDDGVGGPDSVSRNLASLPTAFIPLPDGGFYIIDSDPLTPFDPGDPTTAEPLLIELGDGTDVASIAWNSLWVEDPLVTNNLTVTNILPFAITIDVTVTAPVFPALGSTDMNGSVGVTLTEVAGPATTASASTSGGIDFYRALIDGVEVQDLLDDPYTLSCVLNNCSTSDSDDFGIPVPIPGPAVNTDIAIRIRTVLSAGDAIGVTSVFEIVKVPEPMALGLLGVALAGAFVARRRS